MVNWLRIHKVNEWAFTPEGEFLGATFLTILKSCSHIFVQVSLTARDLASFLTCVVTYTQVRAISWNKVDIEWCVDKWAWDKNERDIQTNCLVCIK